MQTHAVGQVSAVLLTPVSDAVQDADECIRLAPTFAKGYSRKGHLQFFMKEHEKALQTYEAGLKADPSNEELKEGVRRCYEAVSKAWALSGKLLGL